MGQIISKNKACQLGLPITETGVSVVLSLGGVDVILDVSWLETLGEAKVYWRTICISFVQDGRKMKLQEDLSLCKSQVSLKSLFKENEVATEKVFVENVSGPISDDMMQSEFCFQMAEFLQSFEAVF